MYCSKCGNEIKEAEKFCGKCGSEIKEKVTSNVKEIKENKSIIKKKFILIGLAILVVIGIIYSSINGGIFKNNKQVQIPNLVGKTVEEAEYETSKLGLKLKISMGSSNNIITEQDPKYIDNYKIKKNTTINIELATQEEKQKQQEERQKKQEEENKIKDIIKEWAKHVRDANEGSVSYKSHSKYATSDNGKIIYQIVYDTGSKYSEYRQLVALGSDLSDIKGTTKLYYFTYLSNGSPGASGEKEMKWEAEKLWGI